MHVQVLGPLSAARGERSVVLAGQRSRDVLAVLVQRRGHAVSPEVLLDRVWGPGPAGPSVSAVHTVVARIRRALGAGAVLTEGPGYRLGIAQVDEDAFEAGCADAREAAAARRDGQAAATYRTVLALWQGDTAYASVSDHLVDAERARLGESRSRAVEDLCRLLLAQPGDPAAHEAHALATAMVRDHPLRELPYAHLMHAAYRLGRQAQALAVYAALRRRLHEDLGIDPGERVGDLHRRILRHDPGLHATSAGAAPPRRPDTVTRAGRIPTPLTPTVGRQAEIASVLASVGQGRRLVTIVGPGGVGKSRVLAEVGARLAVEGEVGYLDLAGLGAADLDELADRAAVALEVGGSDRPAVDVLVDAFATRRLVVLADEAEWAVEPFAELVGRVLRSCPGVQFVVTSRVPLGVAGERQVLLSPLACAPEQARGQDVLRAPAVRLLAARVGDVVADPRFSDEEALDLGRIARRVDGLPLALEIVAGHAGTRSVGQLLTLLATPLDVATTARSAPARHRTLRDTLGWSVQGLGADARTVLLRLGVFHGPIDPDAAVAVGGPVAGDVDAVVRSLVREALVQVDRSGPRLQFRMLRTIRDLALEGLAESGELATTSARMRHWYAQRWRGQPRSDALIEDVQLHYDDYLAVLRGAIDQDTHAAVAVLTTLSRFWLFGSLRGSGVRWCTRALHAPGLGDLDRAEVLLLRSMLDKTDQDRSLADLVAAIPVLQRHGGGPSLVSAYMGLALHETHRGRTGAALAAAGRAVEFGRQAGAERLADALGVLAVVQGDAEDADGIAVTVAEALELLRAARSSAARVAVTSNLAHGLLNVGRVQRALELVDGVLPLAPRVGGSATVDFLVETAGWAALGCQQPRRALGHFAEVLAGLGADAGRSQYGISATIGAAIALSLVGADAAAPASVLARRRLQLSGFVPPPLIRRLLGGLALPPPGTATFEPDQPDPDAWLLEVVAEAASVPEAVGDGRRSPDAATRAGQVVEQGLS